MRCRYCSYGKLSVIKVWEDKEGITWRRFGCLACGRKFDVPGGGRKLAPRPASKLSRYAKR